MASSYPEIAYRLVTTTEVADIDASGKYEGSAIDAKDGYLHMSTHDTVRESANKYYGGRDDVVLLTIDLKSLGAAVRWDPVASRGGALFPHLYDIKLPASAITARSKLAWNASAGAFEGYPEGI